MTAQSDRMPLVDDGRPDVVAVTTPSEFVAAMRQLKVWSGRSYRELESRAAAAGRVLPRSTMVAALNRDRLPREELLVAFAYTCGCDEDEVARWVVARRRLAVRTAMDEPLTSAEPTDRTLVRPVRAMAMVMSVMIVLAATVTGGWLVWA